MARRYAGQYSDDERDPSAISRQSRSAHLRSYPNAGPSLGTVVFALAAVAGVAALGRIGRQAVSDHSRTLPGSQRRAVRAHEPHVQRSITIEDVPAQELYERWRDPDTLRRVMVPFATVEAIDNGRTRWSAGDGLGRWTMRLSDEQPGEFLRWQAEDGDALIREASVRLHKASGNRGTVVTLHAHLDPPGGMLGRTAAAMLGNSVPGALVSKSLHYFKSLVQTGEIPTTERQPAARPDPR
jgi:uncharacterized membrane protein